MEKLNQLIVRAQSGDLDAYTTIVHRFQDMAVGYARACLGDVHRAEDVAQEAFLQAYLDLSTLKDPAAFPGWFRKIVFKHCNRITRKNQVRVLPLEEIPARTKDPAEALEARETWMQLQAAVQALPMHERQVIHLFYIGDYSRKTIATFLDVPVSTVDNRLRIARRKLKERMSDMQTLSNNAPSHDDRFVQQVRASVEKTWSWYDRAYEFGKGEKQAQRHQQLQRIAEQALTHYDVEKARLTFTRNMIVIGGPMTFRMTAQDRTYALHVYNPAPMRIPNPLQSLSGIRDRSDVLESGLQWFGALNRDTDLTAQEPVPNREGRFVTEVSLNGNEPVNCALLEWVEGDELTGVHKENIGRSVSDMRNLGVMLGKMHRHASQWNPPEGFVLPRMDREKMQTALEVLRWAADQDRLPRADIPVLEEALQKMDGLMADLGESKQVWGSIHTLMPCNAAFCGNEVRPIDYNSFAFGYYLYDIAWSFIWNGPSEKRRAFLEGYHTIRPLPEDHPRLIEAFHVAARTIFLAHYAQNPGEDLKGERKFVEHECASYLKDEPFLFEKGSWREKFYW